jgi:hypothetical protein
MSENNEFTINDITYLNNDLMEKLNEDLKKILKLINLSEKNTNETISLINNIFNNIKNNYIKFINEQNLLNQKIYEPLIQKTENQLRNHIRNEYMLNFQKEILENKVKCLLIKEEYYEKLKQITSAHFENGQFVFNDRKDSEILILKAENSNLKKVVLKYEKEIEIRKKKEKELKNEIETTKKFYEQKISEINNKNNNNEKFKMNSQSTNNNTNTSINFNCNNINESNHSSLIFPSFSLNKKQILEQSNNTNNTNNNSINNFSTTNNFSFIKKHIINNLGIFSDFKTPIKVSTPPYSSRIYSPKNSFQNSHKRYKSEIYVKKNQQKDIIENNLKNLFSSNKGNNKNNNDNLNQIKNNYTIKNSCCITKRNVNKKVFTSKLTQDKKNLNLHSLDTRRMNNFLIYKNSKISTSNLLTSRNLYKYPNY